MTNIDLYNKLRQRTERLLSKASRLEKESEEREYTVSDALDTLTEIFALRSQLEDQDLEPLQLPNGDSMELFA